MKTIAIIQARMGSTRLPGKVMKDLCGHPVIEWVVHRVSKAKLVDEVVVAIPHKDMGSELAAYLQVRGCKAFYGPEEDVLARYYQCAKHYDADYVVRITADCPLVDWEHIDKTLQYLWLNDMKYAEANADCHGLNVEAFSMKMLAMANARQYYGNEREHVTKWMRPRGKGIALPFAGNHPRWTLDEQADLDMLRELCKHGDMDTPWLEFAKVCEEHPEIPAINRDVKQKEV